MMANDRAERPATMPMPRPDAAHHASRSAPTRCYASRCLQVFGLDASVLRDPSQHLWSNFLSVVKCEDEIWEPLRLSVQCDPV